MTHAMDLIGNPSSVHGDGRAQRKLIEDARESVAALAETSPANVVFTSGGSEANNAILRGVPAARIFTTSIEHASVLDAAPSADRLSVTSDGLIDLAALRVALDGESGPAWVSVMAANNETGVIQPIGEVAEIARAAGAKLHVDAIQAPGKMPLAPIVDAADALSLSAHKFGGPQGVGALIVRDGTPFEPLVRGGGQERRRRSGTENVIGIAGFGAACKAAQERLDAQQEIAALRDQIEATLRDRAIVHGHSAPRLSNTSCLRMPGVTAETQVMAFDLAGISVSAGSACSSGKIDASHVLLAMGLPEADASESIRVSLGPETTRENAAYFIEVWQRLSDQAGSEAA